MPDLAGEVLLGGGRAASRVPQGRATALPSEGLFGGRCGSDSQGIGSGTAKLPRYQRPNCFSACPGHLANRRLPWKFARQAS
mmetsp:Transcript_128738/g.325003  ORF Transcript_128738/g.325003 Transcript_128738/m.325003 type:complete len:82 (+) Transcript_128738:399-644(+)